MSCVAGVTGTTGTTFYTPHTLFNIPEEFGHRVDKSQSESKTKSTSAALGNLQDFMDSISNQPSKWEDLEHCHMNLYFWQTFGTYLGQNVKNKTMVKFPQDNKTASKKGVMSRKVARTATSNKDDPQSRLRDELDIIL